MSIFVKLCNLTSFLGKAQFLPIKLWRPKKCAHIKNAPTFSFSVVGQVSDSRDYNPQGKGWSLLIYGSP